MQPQIKFNYPQSTTAAVAISTQTSAEVDIGDHDLVGIITPAEFDGTTITFTGSVSSGGTFYPVAASNAASTAYTVTTTASTLTPINPQLFAGIRYVKAVCGSSQTTSGTNLVFLLRKRT